MNTERINSINTHIIYLHLTLTVTSMFFVTCKVSSELSTLHVYTPESDRVSCPSDKVLSVLKLVPFFFHSYVQLGTHSAVHVMSSKTSPSLTTCVEWLGVTAAVSGPSAKESTVWEQSTSVVGLCTKCIVFQPIWH